MPPFKRIMIFGRPGSGKSTFALPLKKALSLPLYHLDRYFFVENWKERDKEEFLALQKSFVAQDQWIIDGNAMRSLEMRYARADISLFFCYPKLTCLFRVLKRRFYEKKRDIQDRAEGCSEAVHWNFVKYLWTFEKRYESFIEEVRGRYPTTPFFKITTEEERRQVEDFLLKEA